MTCQDCIHYKSIGTLCDKYIYPEERNNEPCDYFEKKHMTCQDCIHISSIQVGKADNFPLYTCNKTSFFVKGIATPCKYFEENESCDEIDFVSDKKTIPVKLKVTKISKHQSDFSDLDMRISCLNESCDSNTGFTHKCMFGVTDNLIDAYKKDKVKCEYLKGAIENIKKEMEMEQSDEVN